MFIWRMTLFFTVLTDLPSASFAAIFYQYTFAISIYARWSPVRIRCEQRHLIFRIRHSCSLKLFIIQFSLIRKIFVQTFLISTHESPTFLYITSRCFISFYCFHHEYLPTFSTTPQMLTFCKICFTFWKSATYLTYCQFYIGLFSWT